MSCIITSPVIVYQVEVYGLQSTGAYSTRTYVYTTRKRNSRASCSGVEALYNVRALGFRISGSCVSTISCQKKKKEVLMKPVETVVIFFSFFFVPVSIRSRRNVPRTEPYPISWLLPLLFSLKKAFRATKACAIQSTTTMSSTIIIVSILHDKQ